MAGQLAGLEVLRCNALGIEWRRVLRTPPPDMNAELKRRAIAYRLQEKVYGGLPATMLRRLTMTTVGCRVVRCSALPSSSCWQRAKLARGLADFAKTVQRLDAKDASFFSVTQAFTTTSGMGRLTLNVLLSFVQFEREVTAKRIRDKIAASKAKGI